MNNICRVCNPVFVRNYPGIVATVMWVGRSQIVSWVVMCVNTSVDVAVCGVQVRGNEW